MKEIFLTILVQYPEVIVYVLTAFFAIAYAVILKKKIDSDSVAKLIGVSTKIKDVLLVIFSHTQYNADKFNSKEYLKNPVFVEGVESEGKKKMLIATRAFEEHPATKSFANKLKKAGNLAIFMQTAYNWLKPFFKRK